MQIILRKLKNLYTSSSKIQSFSKKISSSKLYYQISKKIIQNKIKKEKNGPFNLLIETTSFCNAKCLMCPHQNMKRRQNIMSEEIFNKIIERIKKEKINIYKVYLSGFGEPLTDPNFLERIKKLKKLNLFISFYTNASLLSNDLAKKLIDLKVEEINISFNAVTKNSYEIIMQLDYENTKNKILHLIKLNQINKKSRIRISSVISKQNEKEINKHIAFWQKNKADFVSVSLAHEWGGAVSNKSEHKFLKDERTYPCRSLWHTFAIDSNGDFVLCCRDFDSNFKLGNVKTHTLSQIKNSKILKSFQKSHLKFQKDKLPPICQKCNFPFQDGLEWLIPRSLG